MLLLHEHTSKPIKPPLASLYRREKEREDEELSVNARGQAGEEEGVPEGTHEEEEDG